MDEHRGRTVLVAAVIVAGFVAAALVLTGWLRSGPSDATPSASFPAEARGMKVLTVVDAIAVQARDDASDIALGGFYQQPFLLSCPAPLGPVVQLFEGNCETRSTWLMANPESIVHASSNVIQGGGPSGPAFNVVFDGPGIEWANPLPQTGDSVPTPVVVIGHFDDPRAVGCQPENVQWCMDVFVVTVVDWANGAPLP